MNQNSNHNIARSPIIYEQIIPEKVVDLMIEEILSNEVSYAEAKIGTRESSGKFVELRNSKTSWIYNDSWITGVFAHFFNMVNMYIWEYNLSLLESIQITKYEEGDHYTWHSDYGTSTDEKLTRKLSATMLVSDPDDYEGGDLEFIDYHNNLIVAPKKKGTLIIFDSRTPHRVTKVTKGKRISLVAWMLGPKLV